jgi:hypothetical protein
MGCALIYKLWLIGCSRCLNALICIDSCLMIRTAISSYCSVKTQQQLVALQQSRLCIRVGLLTASVAVQ